MTKPDWQIEHERLTIFWASNPAVPTWTQILGSEPIRVETDNASRTVQEIGSIGSAQVVLINSPGRTDFILQAPGPAAGEFALKADDPSIATYRDAADRWLRGLDLGFSRIAFGRALLYFVGNGSEGYEILKRHLHSVSIVPGRMRDFNYQVNWPTDSKTRPGVEVNRLTKWAVTRFTRMQVGLPTSAETTFATRMEIDLSTPVITAQPESPLILEQACDWLAEFRGIALDIQTNGEPK
ncbi:MAG: hypothetical protein HYZ13_03825 [Acidobacteria bacterium]|nr:hypothetical protein [Acidobacteriota bacterium]